MGMYHFHSNFTAAHPYHSNRFLSCIFPILAHFIQFYSILMSIKDISDLKVWGWHFVFNMDTTCFQSLEKYHYLPFTRLRLCCYFIEILHLMCASLWIITSVVGCLFQWKMEYFIILEHVGCHVYYHVHCLPLHNKELEIMIKGLNMHHYIPFGQFVTRNCE